MTLHEHAPGVLTLEGFLSRSECREWIADSEERTFELAPIAQVVLAPSVRNNERVVFDDVERAAGLWARLQRHLPSVPSPWVASSVNERLRIYRYDPGQFFEWHLDGIFLRDEEERSYWTFMVYLNEAFEGGQTEFVTEGGGFVSVEPRCGMALLFEQHRLLHHRGAEVLCGRKYVLRSDVMVRRPPERSLDRQLIER